MRFIEGLRSRVELESGESQERRYEGYLHGLQRVYEFTWDLRGMFGARLFGGAVDHALRWLQDASFEDVGRKRFFRIAGPIKIPLTPVRE